MKKSCELCKREARMYCDSDQASLCWDCDERVHTANFIVAKHSRSLLCHVCQSITQWKASGSKFGPTFSVCNSCFSNNNNNNNNEEGSRIRRENQENQESEIDGDFNGSHDDDEDYSDSEEEDDDDDDEEEEDGENQVVPWSIPTAAAHPPPVATTSSSSEIGSFSFSSVRRGDKDVSSSAVKRFRNNPFPDSEDEEDACYCSSQVKIRAGVGSVAVEDNVSTGMPTTRRIGKLEGPSPQCQRNRERCDPEWQSTRIMDVGSSMFPRS